MTSKQKSKITPKARGGKKLMSELLTEARKYIEQAEHADVESLRQFLLTNPERPLIAMGHGGAQAIAAAIFLNKTGHSKSDIRSYIEQTFGYDLSRTTDEIRPSYAFETVCDKTMPESIICFLEAESFEDAVIRAISLGGDTDTMGCMAGNIAAASMNVPLELAIFAWERLPLELRAILEEFNWQLYV